MKDETFFIFSTRESFGEKLEAEFNAGDSIVKVDYWACSKQVHQNDGFFCHCPVSQK